jgi:hypothetical protein
MRNAVILVLTFFISLVLCEGIFAQDATVPAEPAASEPQVAAAPMDTVTVQTPAEEPEMQWLYGEAVKVDTATGEVLVKYQDFDTDEEKEMTVLANEKTVFENVKALGEIQPKDALSIDYKAYNDGRNIAKNISVEKAEQPLEAPEDAVSESLQPPQEPVPASPETSAGQQ